MKNLHDIRNLDELLDYEYGVKGTPEREKWEQGFEAFKMGVLISEARKQRKMTQAELAEKCGTNKSYISRIENHAADIRLSTLFRIVSEGLNGKLKLTLEL
jgi:HTH-type transcriptional regulator / antitoxin HipB